MAMAAIGGSIAGAFISAKMTEGSRKAQAAAMSSEADAAVMQASIANDQWERYKETFGPLEDQMVEDVQNLPGPDYQEATGRATSDVMKAFEKARGSTQREMARFGINPASGAGMARMADDGLDAARTNVVARNNARTQEDEQAYRNLRAKGSVASLGRGLPSSAMAGLSNAGATQGNLAAAYGQQAAGTGQFVGNMTGRVIQNLGNGGGGGSDMPSSSYTPYSGSARQGQQNFSNMDFDDISAFSTEFADGGELHGPGDGTSDSINGVVEGRNGETYEARFSDGEYVIPEDVVRKKGTEFFDKLIDKHHTPARGLPMRARG